MIQNIRIITLVENTASGADVTRRFWNVFPDRCFDNTVGTEVMF